MKSKKSIVYYRKDHEEGKNKIPIYYVDVQRPLRKEQYEGALTKESYKYSQLDLRTYMILLGYKVKTYLETCNENAIPRFEIL